MAVMVSIQGSKFSSISLPVVMSVLITQHCPIFSLGGRLLGLLFCAVEGFVSCEDVIDPLLNIGVRNVIEKFEGALVVCCTPDCSLIIADGEGV